jgi:iron complex outermembrane receptor protein
MFGVFRLKNSLCKLITRSLISSIPLFLSIHSLASTKSYQIFDLSLEELLNTPITIAGHISKELRNTPAAVSVLTSEDIKRSGIRQIPELLRLVPGMHVAKMTNSLWSINARNENGLFSGTMLIMIDGRSVYNPLFGGTYWDDIDVYIDDIERIEVTRGPSGSVWGSNAVTGVANIITKKAYDTQGHHAFIGKGEHFLDSEAGWRFGGGDDAAILVNERIPLKQCA